ncbi:unnamed protein product [Urochloa humidicola]
MNIDEAVAAAAGDQAPRAAALCRGEREGGDVQVANQDAGGRSTNHSGHMSTIGAERSAGSAMSLVLNERFLKL